MLKVENNTINLTRGDKAVFSLKIPTSESEFYTFQIGDKITFGVYEKKGMEKIAQILKEYTVETASETFDITLESEDTKIGELINKPVEYWYEVILNDDDTIIGYDESGAKKFIIYPEGSEVTENVGE